MKIVGLKMLDSNFYEKIVINDNMIIASGLDSNLSNTKDVRWPSPISSELGELSDDDITDRVISYFLNYNKIIALSVKPGDNFIGVLSKYGQKLELRGKNSKKFLKKITDRYYHDRTEFFLTEKDNYQHVNLELNLENAAYSVEDDSKGKTLKVCLMPKRTQEGYIVLDYEDILFSKEVIDATMGDSIAESYISEDYAGIDYLEKSCVISNSDGNLERKIYIPGRLIPLMDFIVDNHNSEVFLSRFNEEKEKGKVFQMKMEGF